MTCPSSSFTPSSAFTIMLTLNRDPQSDFSLNRSYFYHFSGRQKIFD